MVTGCVCTPCSLSVLVRLHEVRTVYVAVYVWHYSDKAKLGRYMKVPKYCTAESIGYCECMHACSSQFDVNRQELTIHHTPYTIHHTTYTMQNTLDHTPLDIHPTFTLYAIDHTPYSVHHLAYTKQQRITTNTIHGTIMEYTIRPTSCIIQDTSYNIQHVSLSCRLILKMRN